MPSFPNQESQHVLLSNDHQQIELSLLANRCFKMRLLRCQHNSGSVGRYALKLKFTGYPKWQRNHWLCPTLAFPYPFRRFDSQFNQVASFKLEEGTRKNFNGRAFINCKKNKQVIVMSGHYAKTYGHDRWLDVFPAPMNHLKEITRDVRRRKNHTRELSKDKRTRICDHWRCLSRVGRNELQTYLYKFWNIFLYLIWLIVNRII